MLFLRQQGGNHGQRQEGDQNLAQEGGFQNEREPRAKPGADNRKNNPIAGHAPVYKAVFGKVEQGDCCAAAGADLVCAQRQMGRNAGQQKGGNGQKPPASRYGVNKAAGKSGDCADKTTKQAHGEHIFRHFAKDRFQAVGNYYNTTASCSIAGRIVEIIGTISAYSNACGK